MASPILFYLYTNQELELSRFKIMLEWWQKKRGLIMNSWWLLGWGVKVREEVRHNLLYTGSNSNLVNISRERAQTEKEKIWKMSRIRRQWVWKLLCGGYTNHPKHHIQNFRSARRTPFYHLKPQILLLIEPMYKRFYLSFAPTFASHSNKSSISNPFSSVADAKPQDT